MDTMWSLLSGLLVITIVYMLVRPGSPASQAVADITSALTNLIKTATAGPPTTPNVT